MKKGKQIIMIAGAPTVGKTFVAGQLSKTLGLPWISTDQIREIMWGCADHKTYPKLFNLHDYTAEEFYAKFSGEEIVQKEIDQAEEVWSGITNFIANDYTWKDGFIIEGVALLPYLFKRDITDPNIKMLVLVDKHPERIRNVVFNRGLWSGAKSYPDSVKEKEVDYVILFNEWFENQAKEFDVPLININKSENKIDEIIGLIKQSAV